MQRPLRHSLSPGPGGADGTGSQIEWEDRSSPGMRYNEACPVLRATGTQITPTGSPTQALPWPTHGSYSRGSHHQESYPLEKGRTALTLTRSDSFQAVPLVEALSLHQPSPHMCMTEFLQTVTGLQALRLGLQARDPGSVTALVVQLGKSFVHVHSGPGKNRHSA